METAYLHVNSRIKSLKYWKGFNNEQEWMLRTNTGAF